MSEILGLEAPVVLGPFALVTVGDKLTLDFIESREEIRPQHYAFLVSETEFDEIFALIEKCHLTCWADPHKTKRDQINHWDDGRGVYFEDPNGHLLEILTRPYGSAGTTAANPHPLVAEKLARREASEGTSDPKTAPADNTLACGELPGAVVSPLRFQAADDLYQPELMLTRDVLRRCSYPWLR